MSNGSVKCHIHQSQFDLLEDILGSVTSLLIPQTSVRENRPHSLHHSILYNSIAQSLGETACMKRQNPTRHCLLQRMQNQQKAAERKAKKAAEGGKALAKRGRKKCAAAAEEDESEREGESVPSTSMTLRMLSGLSWHSAVLC